MYDIGKAIKAIHLKIIHIDITEVWKYSANINLNQTKHSIYIYKKKKEDSMHRQSLSHYPTDFHSILASESVTTPYTQNCQTYLTLQLSDERNFVVWPAVGYFTVERIDFFGSFNHRDDSGAGLSLSSSV